MMKLINLLWQILLLTTLSLAKIDRAKGFSILGAYKSNGYTLDLNSRGDYHSCDPQNRCLTIPHTQASQQGKIRVWKRAGYTYRVTPIGKPITKGYHPKISVRVIDSKNKVIFDRIFRSQ
jgi:hypothetical protein